MIAAAGIAAVVPAAIAQIPLTAGVPPATHNSFQQNASSYMPVTDVDDFGEMLARMESARPQVMQRQQDLLNARYDLSNHSDAAVTMSRGKPLQEGVRVRLPEGLTWDKLAAMTPDEVRRKEVFPGGFLPLPHRNHPEGGMLFPKFHIDEINKQEGRDLRFRSNRNLSSWM